MFDVRSQPWLPVLERDGSVREVGLFEAFERAHELRDLATQTPLEYVAVFRLLVAIVHRALDGPRTFEDGRRLYTTGRIPPQVPLYLRDSAGVWDLFDRDRPWLQAPSAASDAHGDSPVSRLLPWQPSGNNPVFWEHVHDNGRRALTPAEAARALVVVHSYALGGGVASPFNFTDGTIARSLVCVALGGSLASTVLLNAVLYNGDDPIPRSGDDAPAWERRERVPVKEKTPVSGYVDFLTLTTRRVLLMRDSDGRVRRCLYAQGLAPRDIGARDPFVPYEKTKRGPVAMRPTADRALWRDLPAITAGLSGQQTRESTGVLRWAARLTDGAPLRLRAVGMVCSQAKIDTVVDGELRLPPAIALSVDHRTALKEAVKRAEDAEKALLNALQTAAEHAGAVPEAARGVSRRLFATTPFWAQLEGPYQNLVEALGDLSTDQLEDQSEPERHWSALVLRETRRSYEDAVRLLGSGPRELIGAARGRGQLERWISKSLRATTTTAA